MDKADKLFAQLGYKREPADDSDEAARHYHLQWSGFEQHVWIMEDGGTKVQIGDASVIVSGKEITAIYKALREEGMMCGWGKEWKG